jgi:hypothetical protein
MPGGAKIDVTLITKEKLFKGSKPNAENKLPLYLDIVIIATPNDQYGNDFMIVEALSKEERAQGMKQGKKLGKGKFFGASKAKKNNQQSSSESSSLDYLP